MKVFLSWSGPRSHKVAIVLRDWLPSVIQSIHPYVSSEDIDKGTRWSTDIAKELENSAFGVLCVTKENLSAPWLTFEAGALSKTMDKSFVVPFLFDVKRSEVDGPILQFQSTITQKSDILKFVKTLNKACEEEKLTDERLEKAFGVWYPNLKDELDKIKELKPDTEEPSASGESVESGLSNEILEELLELTRIQHKLIRSPESLLPPDYFEHLYRRMDRRRRHPRDENLLEHGAWHDLVKSIKDLELFYRDIQGNKSVGVNRLEELIQRIMGPFRYIEERWVRNRRNEMDF